jgi:hypothetical protein
VSDRHEFGSEAATKPFAPDWDGRLWRLTLNKFGDCVTLITRCRLFRVDDVVQMRPINALHLVIFRRLQEETQTPYERFA